LQGGGLIINVYGLIISPYERPKGALPVQQVIQMMDRAYQKKGATHSFLEKATELYAQGIDYQWPQHKARVHPADNWLLWALAWADPAFMKLDLTNVENLFTAYESLSWERALARGYGICSQNSLGLADLLSSRYGIEADIIGLDGHVVVEAQSLLLDPSVGLTIPMNLQEAEKHEDQSQKISQLYNQTFPDKEYFLAYDITGQLVTKKRLSELGQTYDTAGNQRFDGVKGYRPKIYYLERISEWLKWAIPITMLLVGLWVLLQTRRTFGGSPA